MYDLSFAKDKYTLLHIVLTPASEAKHDLEYSSESFSPEEGILPVCGGVRAALGYEVFGYLVDTRYFNVSIEHMV